jgi:hypothetical protein
LKAFDEYYGDVGYAIRGCLCEWFKRDKYGNQVTSATSFPHASLMLVEEKSEDKEEA